MIIAQERGEGVTTNQAKPERGQQGEEKGGTQTETRGSTTEQKEWEGDKTEKRKVRERKGMRNEHLSAFRWWLLK